MASWYQAQIDAPLAREAPSTSPNVSFLARSHQALNRQLTGRFWSWARDDDSARLGRAQGETGPARGVPEVDHGSTGRYDVAKNDDRLLPAGLRPVEMGCGLVIRRPGLRHAHARPRPQPTDRPAARGAQPAPPTGAGRCSWRVPRRGCAGTAAGAPALDRPDHRHRQAAALPPSRCSRWSFAVPARTRGGATSAPAASCRALACGCRPAGSGECCAPRA
jgi:hypothetical protein